MISGLLRTVAGRTGFAALVVSAAIVWPFVPGRAAAQSKGAAARSAETLLAEAMNKARDEHKMLLVEVGASWCPPCRVLEAFLNAPNTSRIVASNYVVVHLTVWEQDEKAPLNNPGAEALMHKWGADSIPLVMLLDASGHEVARGNDVGDARGRQTFMMLVDRTRPALTPTERAAILADLRHGLGSIAGRVTDDRGLPVARAQVFVVGATDEGTGQNSAGWRVETNTAGQFQLEDVPTGDVRVFAETDTLSAMTVVTVRPDADPIGVDIALAPHRTADVSGAASGSNGTPIVRGRVTLVNLDRPMAAYEGTTGPGGVFTVHGVRPGRYNVWIRSALPSTVTAPEEWGFRAVVVTSTPVDSLRVTTKKGATLSGVLSFEGGRPTAADLAAVQVTAIAVSPAVGGPRGDIQSPLGTGGQFTLRGLFGSRVIRVRNLPANWTLKSIHLNGDDITDKPIDLTAVDGTGAATLLVTSRGAEVTGTAIDAASKPLHGGAVIVFAEDAARWTYLSRFLRFAPIDGKGAFTVRGLPAGRYLVAAVESLLADWDSPAALSRLSLRATPLLLEEGTKRIVTLSANPAKDR